jgi:hypothetical protein
VWDCDVFEGINIVGDLMRGIIIWKEYLFGTKKKPDGVRGFISKRNANRTFS